MKPWQKIASFVVVLVVLSILFLVYPPSQIVNTIGIQNSLLVAFVVSLLGGVSTVTSASFYTVIGAFAIGGVPIGLMAIVCGPALLAGDLFFYFFGASVHDVLPARIASIFDRAQKWIKPGNNNWVQLGIVVYTGLSPFPGDILMVVLALSEYPLRRIVWPLLFGNIVLVWVISYLATTGESVWGLFLGLN